MKNIILIPSRYNSRRFPGKPLALISGKSLIERVWAIAKSVQRIDEVYIATDDTRIKSHAESFCAKVIMTDACENGTERISQAINTLPVKPDLILNLQGDAVLIPPSVIQQLIDVMLNNQDLGIATTATLISPEEYAAMQTVKFKGEVGGTMVVCDKSQNALYFSKGMIPYLREISSQSPPLYRHIGLYGYRYWALQEYIGLESTPLEKIEGLEQLRALENGMPIKVVFVDYQGRTHASIDSPEDVARVEKIIEKEDELVFLVDK